jgi:hypothetical protein
VFSSRIVPNQLNETCVLEFLRTAAEIDEIVVQETGREVARLDIPEGLDHPAIASDIAILQEVREDGLVEFELRVVWFGIRGTREYTAYVQDTIDDLADRAIRTCSGMSDDDSPAG